MRWLKCFADAVERVRSSVLGIAVVTLVACGVLGIIAVAKLIFSPAVEIDVIEAPQGLQGRGLTTQSAARLLEEAIISASNKARDRASDALPSSLRVAADTPDITVPGAGVSLAAVVAYLRSLGWGSGRVTLISGQITVSGTAVALRLIVNDGQPQTVETADKDGDSDKMFATAAEKVMKIVWPYAFAAYLYASNRPEDAIDSLRTIAASEGKDALKAYYLWAYILGEMGDHADSKTAAHALYDEAKRVYRNGADFAKKHGRRVDADLLAASEAAMFEKLGDVNVAISKLCGVIVRSQCQRKDLTFVYVLLGRALRHGAQFSTIQSSAVPPSCFKAIGWRHPSPTGRCSNLADRQCVEGWARDGATAALTRALELAPSATTARNQLANVLRDQGRLTNAVAAFHDAIDHNGGADANIGLGTTLRRMPGRLSEAAASFERAIKLGDEEAQSPAHWALGKIYFRESRAAADSTRRSACLIKACGELAQAQVKMSWMDQRDYKDDDDFADFTAACPPPWHMTDMLRDLVAYVSRSPQPTCDLPQ